MPPSGLRTLMSQSCGHLPQSRETILPLEQPILFAELMPQGFDCFFQLLVRLLELFGHFAVRKDDAAQFFHPLGGVDRHRGRAAAARFGLKLNGLANHCCTSILERAGV